MQYNEMPDYVKIYTEKGIPTRPTEDEIDEWLAVIPDLLEYWEREVAQKRLEYDMQEYAAKQSQSFAYTQTDENLAVKNRESLAACSPAVVEANNLSMQKKYELNIVQAIFNNVESKGKSIHKIATLRVRRLEQGIVPASVSSSQGGSPKRPKPDRNGIVWNKSGDSSPQSLTDSAGKNQPSKTSSPDVTTVKTDKVSRVDGNDVISKEMRRELNSELYKEDKEVF